MQERIQHVLQGQLGRGGPGGKTFQGDLQGLGHAVISQEAHALDLKGEKGREDRHSQSLLHTSPLYPPPLALLTPHWLLWPELPLPQRRWSGGSSLIVATWHPLPTHLQKEATQSLECGVREGREVSQSSFLQNKTHLFEREDGAALEAHKLAQGEKPQTQRFGISFIQTFPVLLCAQHWAGDMGLQPIAPCFRELSW